ncbi:DUF3995 domain-containing protein [Flammeovirga aprica]|uniref:DUF3995 domain-containing protein n=1 Tax=Flammeovirga aprica JL-4 TaxID=694437 RepID=A0A7X9RTW6_9BACT|nr:DUF3995 domain-containing protein [Flammeovirga aprica]NME67937.1 DUF3995 domain-containing protein [Flammeovirga aprica JL-4]
MITIILSSLLVLLFTFLGGIHFYWLFGGKWGVHKVIPTKANEATAFETPPIATFMVGMILFSFGLIYFLKLNLFIPPVSEEILRYGYWGIPFIFILRAIGEFNYVGFFKRVRGTEFAEADTKFFSPLCLGVGVIGLMIEVVKYI